jgi:hypothetical protein
MIKIGTTRGMTDDHLAHKNCGESNLNKGKYLIQKESLPEKTRT